MDSKAERALASGYLGRPPLNSARPFVWSPDGKWIAYTALSGKSFRNIHVVPLTGGTGQPVSFLANSFNNTVSWSPDGTYLLFDTNQRTENGQIARVDLVPRTPKFREDQFRDLFKEESPRPPRNAPAEQPRDGSPAAEAPRNGETGTSPSKPVGACGARRGRL